MEPRRQLLSILLMLGFVVVWFNVAPLLFPNAFKRPNPNPQPVVQNDPAEAQLEPAAGKNVEEGAQPPATAPLSAAQFPTRTLLLGDASKGYLQRLELSSRGAAIAWQQLTEPQYQTENRSGELRLLGNSHLETAPETLAVNVPQFDAQLGDGKSLASVNWEFVEASSEAIPGTKAWKKVVFRYPAPDGAWEAIKTFALTPAEGVDSRTDPRGYLVDVALEFVHKQEGEATLNYVLQGPVGLPLENADNARIFRTVKGGTLTGGSQNSVTAVSETASALVKQVEKAEAANNPGQRPSWRYPVRWAGVDVQYFAALLIPQDDQTLDADHDGQPDSYFEEVVPTIVQQAKPVEQSDVSVVFKSRKLKLPAAANSSVTHKFQLYLGPKRVHLLDSFDAQSVMDFGWFAPISRGMAALLSFFHSALGLPYFFAIILLTVIVRGALFPLSKRQVANVQKMKDLSPKLAELKEKYKDDKEALARAQWEFMKKHGYNPFAGCLPIVFQLPIFVGLYNALSTAIDLRLARFLWINDLAAPDALFHLPFTVPFTGWTEFNLLPLVTVALFIVQNKLFTPPPTNDEQAMQFKMMNVMMAVMGVMFYRVPAGLCVYFIASSLWGICERKLLDRHKRNLEAQKIAAGGVLETTATVRPDAAPTEPPQPGFLARLMEAADRAKHSTSGQGTPRLDRKTSPGSKSKR